ncbi:MAG: prolipoprotein diacylglyceryl transferase, partial [Paludibacteraceae bacterium]|nr:prolipoprotein diacylglyceryl transferase [Paludibacteraceae bacterium]
NIHHWQAGADPVFSVPSHPTQIYEALYCIVTFSILMFLYWRTNARKFEGFIFGIFLIGVFLTRFILEFIKNNQEDFEEEMSLNMGQLLSIPLILWGVYMLYKSIGQMKKEGGLKITHE